VGVEDDLVEYVIPSIKVGNMAGLMIKKKEENYVLVLNNIIGM
jgi:hypothetical protein